MYRRGGCVFIGFFVEAALCIQLIGNLSQGIKEPRREAKPQPRWLSLEGWISRGLLKAEDFFVGLLFFPVLVL